MWQNDFRENSNMKSNTQRTSSDGLFPGERKGKVQTMI